MVAREAHCALKTRVAQRHAHKLREGGYAMLSEMEQGRGAKIRAPGTPGTHAPPPRGYAARHPRWAQLGLEDDRSEDLSKVFETLQLGTKAQALGPAHVRCQQLTQSVEEDILYNNYNQHFVDSRLRTLPGSWVQNVAPETRFSEHPKLRRLLEAKAQLVDQASIPPTYLCTDLRAWQTPDRAALPLELQGMTYDVIVLDPPLASYAWDEPSLPRTPCWTWDEIAALPVPQLASRDSFVFLWVGSGTSDGLERGREVLAKWGYRRCEDVVWIRTNHEDDAAHGSTSLLHTSVQHCLMGIRGTVVRSTDSFFVHCNVDTDVILWPGESLEGDGGAIAPTKKPHELYTIAENFCLGTRRLELFGTNRNIRRGWLTVGNELGPEHPEWDDKRGAEPLSHVYRSHFTTDPPGCPLHMRTNLLPYSEVCDNLRPKTPPRTARAASVPMQHAKSDSYLPFAPSPTSNMFPQPMPYGHSPAYSSGTQSPAGYSPGHSGYTSPTGYAFDAPYAPWPGMHGYAHALPSYSTPDMQGYTSTPSLPGYAPDMQGYAQPPMPGYGYPHGHYAYAPPHDYQNAYGYGYAAPVQMDAYLHPAPYVPQPYAFRPPVYQPQPPRSALLGQGAGGRATVSVPSGSERLSGAQAQVLRRGQRALEK